MVRLSLFALLVGIVSCQTTTYYVSRHAEKATAPAADPPLTALGETQATRLRIFLQNKGIKGVYSTNYQRTRSTAAPTASHYGLPVILYSAANGVRLVDSLKIANRSNVLIVGHSNTVDDVVNRFTGTVAMRDLPDSAYGDVFIIRKKGNTYRVDSIRLR